MKKESYQKRRKSLATSLKSGLAVFIGNVELPMNYNANTYHFRQDSSFLYFFGMNMAGLVGVIDCDEGKSTVFGDERTIDDVIWMGKTRSLRQFADDFGIEGVAASGEIESVLRTALTAGRRVHFLMPYQHPAQLALERWLGIRHDLLKYHVSADLIRAIVKLREIKDGDEIEEIKKAISVSALCYEKIAEVLRDGAMEYEIMAECSHIATKNNCSFSFPPIITKNGQTLHNHFHGNRLQDGDLLLVDSGVETDLGYASDITRTFAVSGHFTPHQKGIYDLVLKMQLDAIAAIREGVFYRDVHLVACRTLVAGLKELGLMKGSVEDAVSKGAHALFFPHGLGHMMGLDVHDMENLGENHVGYDGSITRSSQFGLAYLRLAKRLQPGFVLTVEPGVYFIPDLIDLWEKEGKFKDFLNYDKVREYIGLGGVRIEDDILVEKNGALNLSDKIRK